MAKKTTTGRAAKATTTKSVKSSGPAGRGGRANDPRRQHLQWALELTGIPTAAGREHRVLEWIDRWLKPRRNLALKRDRHGNLLISIKGRRGGPTVLFTAHLDHPAFVVRRVLDERRLELEFRGGIKESYFDNGRVVVYDRHGGAHRARIVEHEAADPFHVAIARLAQPTDRIAKDDLATWDLKPARVRRGLIEAPACDDLAGAAAALSALDVLRRRRSVGDVRVLLTRAEEVGFVGAIFACENGFIPKGSKVIALECSRSFAESPIGGGPIVRVGDKMSVFSPDLTYEVSQIAEDLAASREGFRFQRRLMPGGTCEATTFTAYGHEATCLCLPLGHYHNMGDVDRVLAGTNDSPARVAPEFVAEADFHGLVELLVACGAGMTAGSRRVGDEKPLLARMRKIRDARGFVLTEAASRR